MSTQNADEQRWSDGFLEQLVFDLLLLALETRGKQKQKQNQNQPEPPYLIEAGESVVVFDRDSAAVKNAEQQMGALGAQSTAEAGATAERGANVAVELALC